jgi:hypoxanthine phosphoribosyltransferase
MNDVLSNVVAFAVGVLASIGAALILRFGVERVSLRFSFRRLLRDIHKLHGRIEGDGFAPDRIVTIDRNGTIVGGMLAGLVGFDTVLAIGTATERLASGERVTIVPSEHLPRPEAVNGKKLLILICFNDTGTSLESVYKALSSPPFAPAEVRLAALYTSVSPKLRPKYFAYEVGRDLKTSINLIVYKMPWMSRDWRHILASERLPQDYPR